MRRALTIFFRYFFFWLIYFWISNVIFLLYNYKHTLKLSFSEISKVLFIGTRMDLSMAGYLSLIPGILLSISFLFSFRVTKFLFKAYTLLLLIVVTFLNILDLGLYPHWGTRVGINAFDYIGDIKGMMANVTFGLALSALFFFLAYLILFSKFYNSFIHKKITSTLKFKWYVAPLLLFFSAFLIIPIRGGFNTSPMNLSFVSFSNKLYANQAASNYLWHFFYTVDKRSSYTNPCLYYEQKKAMEIFNATENTRKENNTTLIDTTISSPNVILIILESFSNKLIPHLGGTFHACPKLNELSQNAISFSSFYASGNRSDRGISAILGGYPSLLEKSIMRFPDKSSKLTLLSHYFNRNNYKTSFYYGGDIDFYDMKSYILQGEYNKIVAQEQFPVRLRRMTKWGVPDEYLFQKALEETKQEKQPFLKVIYTISSHPPFDVPFNKIKGNSNEAKFLNAAAYTDSCLGVFVNELKQTNIWNNTLVIISADHGYSEPGQTDVTDPKSYKIPLIWTGGVVVENKIIDNIGGQPDLIPTLVKQLGWESDSTLFGHDLFSTPSYAFYMHNTGWGYVNKQNSCFFNQDTKETRCLNKNKKDDSYLDFPKAYLQVLHNDFLTK